MRTHHHHVRASLLVAAASSIAGGSCLAQTTGVALTRRIDGALFAQRPACVPPSATSMLQHTGPDGFGDWCMSFVGPRASVCNGAHWVELAGEHISSIAPDFLLAELSLSFAHSDAPPEDAALVAVAGSLFSYTFSVDQPVLFTIRGNTGGVEGGGSVQLAGSEAVVFERDAIEGGPFWSRGELAPGEYTLLASAYIDFAFTPGESPQQGNGYLSLSVLLEPATPPCDWNHDARVDSADFFAFLQSFFAGDADFNADGMVNSRDFFDFLACFFVQPDAPK